MRALKDSTWTPAADVDTALRKITLPPALQPQIPAYCDSWQA